MDKKHCIGCRNDFYNGKNPHGVEECWHLKDAKLVWRIPIGNYEPPPYRNKKKVRKPHCFHESGPNRTHYVDPDDITDRGYWK